MEDMKLCQSCGMPMGDTDEFYGTEADGSKSKDYCKYCYDAGAFTDESTMSEMIEICVPHVIEGNSGMTADDARVMMNQLFPMLKRWKTA